jgi:uncharacterized protein with NRDE domain
VCTLIAAFRAFPTWSLVIAANRDERLDRASSPPRIWPGPPAFIAPRDDAAGGTWLGLNCFDVFVGVTNRFGVDRDERRESRGKLVAESLAYRSARALHEHLAALYPTRFNAFHLLYADRSNAYVTWSNGAAVSQSELSPGVHIITERSLGGDDHERTELIRSRWPAKGSEEISEAHLAALLRLHAANPIGGVCVHADALNYGTRSSTLLFLGKDPASTRLLWAEGHPCAAEYQSEDSLLRQLRASALPEAL